MGEAGEFLRAYGDELWSGRRGDLLGFGAVGAPVLGRESDAPEAGRGLEELESDLVHSCLSSFNLDHAAHLLFVGFEVLQDEQLADV